MKTVSIAIVIIIGLNMNGLRAQQKWTFEQCLTHALQNNLNIKQQELNIKMAGNYLYQSRMDLLPNLNGNGNYNLSSGWSVNPFTNDFTRSDVGSINVGLSSSVTLFSGFQKLNTIKQNQKELESSHYSGQKMKNDISLGIASAFLEILFNQEILKVAEKKVEISKQDVEKTRQLVEAGSLAKGALFESESQLALDEANFINTDNNLKNSMLNLQQMLDLDTLTNFQIEIPPLTTPAQWKLESVETIYRQALQLPEIKQAEANLQSSKIAVKIAQGARYPSVSASASYGTGYSNAENLMTGAKAEPIDEQFKNNASTSVGVTLAVPIFNRWMVQRNVNNAQIGVENSTIVLAQAHNQLYKEIQQAHTNTQAAIANLEAGQKAYKALQESFFYTAEKYKVGMVSIYDFNKIKNTLNQTESDMIRYKYDAIFKALILDFYAGKNIELK